MDYTQGPLLLQSGGNVAIVTSDYDFAGYTADQLGDLDTTLAGWDAFLADAGVLLAEPSNPFPDVDIDAAILDVATYADPESLLGIDAMVAALGVADISLGVAIGLAPAEAWQDTSGAFVAPGPVETLGVPVIPADAIDFSVTGTVSSGATTTIPVNALPATTVTLLNTSQYGNANFRVGDEWQITVHGPVGQTVYAYAVFQGEDIGGGPQGTIGIDGTLTVRGTMIATQAGVWSEQWWVGSVIVETFNFVVVDD